MDSLSGCLQETRTMGTCLPNGHMFAQWAHDTVICEDLSSLPVINLLPNRPGTCAAREDSDRA